MNHILITSMNLSSTTEIPFYIAIALVNLSQVYGASVTQWINTTNEQNRRRNQHVGCRQFNMSASTVSTCRPAPIQHVSLHRFNMSCQCQLQKTGNTKLGTEIESFNMNVLIWEELRTDNLKKIYILANCTLSSLWWQRVLPCGVWKYKS